MTQHIPDKFFTKPTDRTPFAMMNGVMPLREADEDEENEENDVDGALVVRKPGPRLDWPKGRRRYSVFP